MNALVINDRRHSALSLLDPNRIPPMTHELSSAWDQPSTALIEIDNTHALMSYETFLALPEYSGTTPSGVYEGKMWRRNNGLFDRAFRAAGGKLEWLLCWYGLSKEPKMVSINSRKIILLDIDINSLDLTGRRPEKV